jgi:hypothetical protein
MSTIEVGNVSESIVLAAYVRAGFLVAVPFGNGCAYDLVVDIGTRLLKIQVKTGWQDKGCLRYKGRRRIKDSKQDCMRRYRKGEVDFFAIYFPPSDSIYVLPLDAVSGDGCLRLYPVLNGQQKLIRWAADYAWDKHIEHLREDQVQSAVG